MDSTDVSVAEIEMTDEELASVYGGQASREACEYEVAAGEDHVFM